MLTALTMPFGDVGAQPCAILAWHIMAYHCILWLIENQYIYIYYIYIYIYIIYIYIIYIYIYI